MPSEGLGVTKGQSARYGADAVRMAREVVGLYGDPEATWAIAVEVTADAPVVVDAVAAAAADLVADHPHLGSRPAVRSVDTSEWGAARAELAARAFTKGGPLLRLAVDEVERRLLVVAHHGICDGLGLVAIVGVLLGVEVEPRARGVADRRSPRGFLRGAVMRVGQALLRRTPRVTGTVTRGAAGESLLVATFPRAAVSTTDLCCALLQMLEEWPVSPPSGKRVLLVGASRRPRGSLGYDRKTAYLRLSVARRWTREVIRDQLHEAAPEPDFPETSLYGLGPLVARPLRGRLGATALLSNLGILETSGLRSVSFFPAVSGPKAVAIGLASTPRMTTVTLRTRRAEFTTSESETLLTLLANHLLEQRGQSR